MKVTLRSATTRPKQKELISDEPFVATIVQSNTPIKEPVYIDLTIDSPIKSEQIAKICKSKNVKRTITPKKNMRALYTKPTKLPFRKSYDGYKYIGDKTGQPHYKCNNCKSILSRYLMKKHTCDIVIPKGFIYHFTLQNHICVKCLHCDVSLLFDKAKEHIH